MAPNDKRTKLSRLSSAADLLTGLVPLVFLVDVDWLKNEDNLISHFSHATFQQKKMALPD